MVSDIFRRSGQNASTYDSDVVLKSYGSWIEWTGNCEQDSVHAESDFSGLVAGERERGKGKRTGEGKVEGRCIIRP